MSDDSDPSIGKRIRHYNDLEAQIDELKAALLRTDRYRAPAAPNRWAAFGTDEIITIEGAIREAMTLSAPAKESVILLTPIVDEMHAEWERRTFGAEVTRRKA